ncbi:FG-GAP-like repeat-containing protein [Streptomyces sp. NPDC005012]|uniref:FG-GAP-like repeat-containing protein n=1 Tax=Streptomyces sp. NPDC005012 TaxID=3154558 RepID=UPI0033A3042C
MPVPTQEVKLEIVNAATGKTLGSRTVPGTGGVLVVRESPEDGPARQQWQIVPVRPARDEQVYVIRSTGDGEVLEQPAAAGGGVRREAPTGRTTQQWRLVPVDGEAALYVIESAADDTVLDLDLDADPGTSVEDAVPVVVRAYDEDAESQRWRLVPAEPERVSDPALRWARLAHWNGRQSWRLSSSAALRPAPGATPSFSDLLLVLDRFGSDQEAGGWETEGAAPHPGAQPGSFAGLGARFLAGTAGTAPADIVALEPAKGVVSAAARGDGTFEDEERVLLSPAPSPNPADLWTLADITGEGRPGIVVLTAAGVRVYPQEEDGTFRAAADGPALQAFGHGDQAGGWRVDRHPRFLADTTGNGRLDIVGCHDDGVWISLQDADGKFALLADAPALRAFGNGEKAGGWRVDRHPRFLADTTGNGRLDIVGCHDDGVWISLQDEDGVFAEPLYVLDEFGTDQGWTSSEEHPRFLLKTIGDGATDIVGFGPHGVVVARGLDDGTFERSQLVLNDFGTAQGWTARKHLRFFADVTGDGNPDIVGFGDEGVWVAHNRGDGMFGQAQLVCRGFGYDDDAGAWRVGHHPRFLADITGDGRVDIIGFGGPGVYVARNLHRRFRTR